MQIDSYTLILIVFFVQILISIAIVKLFLHRKQQSSADAKQQQTEYMRHTENQHFVNQVDKELEKILEARRNNQIH